MYDIPRKAPLVYLSSSANVQQDIAEDIIAFAAECANAGVKRVYWLFSTPGGKVSDGINVYNVLRGMPFELAIHNVANVDSIGNVIFLATDERYAVPSATFMFHTVGIEIKDTRLDFKSGMEIMESIQNDKNRMVDIIEKHITLPRRQIDNLFHRQREKDVRFALEAGIISDVREVKVEAGAPVIALRTKRENGD
jgi:ATP-dependent Clp protease, protease subunit